MYTVEKCPYNLKYSKKNTELEPNHKKKELKKHPIVSYNLILEIVLLENYKAKLAHKMIIEYSAGRRIHLLFCNVTYSYLLYPDRAERYGFLSRFLLIHSPFILPSFFSGGKRKGEKNNQRLGQKSCLSARSCTPIKIIDMILYSRRK